MQVRATISPAPIVGQDVNLHIEVHAATPAPNTLLTVTLPAEIELVSGSLTWAGDITADQTVNLDLTIRVTAEGERWISVYAFSYDSPGAPYGFGGLKGLYLQSFANSANVIEDIYYSRPTPPVIEDYSDQVFLTPTVP